MGTAVATGANRAVDAANRAISSPLLEDNSIQGAQGILINICGSSSLSLHEVHEASSVIQKAAHENANIIFGAVMDDAMKDMVKITVIAAGFKETAKKQMPQKQSFLPADVEGRARGAGAGRAARCSAVPAAQRGESGDAECSRRGAGSGEGRSGRSHFLKAASAKSLT